VLPVLEIVTYSITLIGPLPPAKTPRIEEAQAAKSLLTDDKSPKSTAFPVLEIVA
jgi:hypothetical protein